MKIDWKKTDKQFYLPKNRPELIEVPPFQFFTIKGAGNPNDEAFGEYIGVLYSLSYAIRMSSKQGTAPKGYYEYTVFPLEGIWDLQDPTKWLEGGELDKDNLKYTLMIRQPGFVTHDYALQTIERTMKKKPHTLLEKVAFEEVEDGRCIQMMHLGSYDNEPESFRLMEQFAIDNNLKRKGHTHREIYLSDFRRTAPEKLKTVLRFWADNKV